MEQEDQAPAVFRAELHREYASTCAFLSYVIYDGTIGENQLENQPMLQAQNDPAADDIHWGVFSTDSLLYLCFRGSVTASDWITNFAVKPFNEGGYSFHSGFYTAMHNAFPSIMLVVSQHLGNRKLIVTGHSLGGALAQIFAFMYERECLKNNINSAVECVITFAAPQACNRTPEEHTALRDKCINYACCTDPVPMLPGLICNPNAAQIVQNMAWESSTVYGVAASIFKSQFSAILANESKQEYLQMYRAFAHTVIVPHNTADHIAFLTPDAHSALVSRSKENMTISSHGMLFYLGELRAANLLSNVVATWFVNRNGSIRAGNHELIPEYYDINRIMRRVQRTWTDLLQMVARPANVLRALIPLPAIPRLVRYTSVFSRGSEYYFIEASISEDELTSLLHLCYDQVGQDNIQLYRPEDYSWIHEIKNIVLFLTSIRPVSWAERQFGDIHEREQCIQKLIVNDPFNTVRALSADQNLSPALRTLVNEILLRCCSDDAVNQKDQDNLISSISVPLADTFDRSHAHHRSVCLFLCYSSYASCDAYKKEMESQQPNLVAYAQIHEVAYGTCEWRLYEDDANVYLCFGGAVTREDYAPHYALTPIVVLDGTYKVHSGCWSHMLIAYNGIIQAIQQHLRGRSLVVTGHSLGGGVAQLFALQYDYECQKNELPPVTSVISFAAQQVAMDSPPTHDRQLAKYVNYTCLHDPVPLFPTILAHPNAARYVVNMSGSIAGSLFSSRISSLIDAMPRSLQMYHPLASTVVVSPVGLNSIAPSEYHSRIMNMTIDDIDKLQIKHHTVLFYLGAFNQLDMLTAGVAEWYDKLERNKDTPKSFIRGIIEYIAAPFK